MNKRIPELVDQCWEEDGVGPAYLNPEKFAELIVKECMEVTVNYPHPVTKLTASEHIARHFGVEE